MTDRFEPDVIIDYLDERVGPDRALTPCSGRERRRVLKLVAVAVGSAEKSVLTVYEKRFRPQDKWHAPWVDMIAGQARDGFRWLDAQLKGPFLAGEKMTQADVTAAIAYEFVQMANPELFETFDCPELGRLASRLSQLEAFKRTRPES